MRLLLPALALAGAILPAAALSAALYAAPGRAPTVMPAAPGSMVTGVEPVKAYSNNLLVVSASAGLRLSRDGGATWATPRGVPPRGSFSALVADPNPTHSGIAYATNGDIYQTRDGGQNWRRLSVAPDALGPAGATALACGDNGTLYAAGATVLAYRGGARWEPVGRGWPETTHVSLVLATSANGLYAVAGNWLLNLTSETARWTPVAHWSGAINAMTLGPDGITPYVAVQGQGIWRIEEGAHHLDGNGLSDTTVVYALRSDPVGNDLYAATGSGLVRLHDPAASSSADWNPGLIPSRTALVALQPSRNGAGMLALTHDGVLFEGTRRGGQRIFWPATREHRISAPGPVVAALSGAEWQPTAALSRLPATFTALGACATFGAGPEKDFDVCGPFEKFYVLFGGPTLFDYPASRAYPTDKGVAQDFGRTRFEWDEGLAARDARSPLGAQGTQGVRLAPLDLGKILAGGHRRFPHPSREEVVRFTTAGADRGVYVNATGYYVDPRFFPFWRQYIDPPTGISIFGLPISQVLSEPSSDGTGQLVHVQYFQNARLEDRGGTVTMSFLNSVPVR